MNKYMTNLNIDGPDSYDKKKSGIYIKPVVCFILIICVILALIAVGLIVHFTEPKTDCSNPIQNGREKVQGKLKSSTISSGTQLSTIHLTTKSSDILLTAETTSPVRRTEEPISTTSYTNINIQTKPQTSQSHNSSSSVDQTSQSQKLSSVLNVFTTTISPVLNVSTKLQHLQQTTSTTLRFVQTTAEKTKLVSTVQSLITGNVPNKLTTPISVPTTSTQYTKIQVLTTGNFNRENNTTGVVGASALISNNNTFKTDMSSGLENVTNTGIASTTSGTHGMMSSTLSTTSGNTLPGTTSMRSTAKITCQPIFCVLNCGNPPVYKTDKNGCNICACA